MAERAITEVSHTHRANKQDKEKRKYTHLLPNVA